jgi:hypothetical protein
VQQQFNASNWAQKYVRSCTHPNTSLAMQTSQKETYPQKAEE